MSQTADLPETSDIENEIIGSVLKDSTLYSHIRFLEAGDFTDFNRQIIWQQITSCAAEGKALSVRSICAGRSDIDAFSLTSLVSDASANYDSINIGAKRISSARRRVRVTNALKHALATVQKEEEGWEKALPKVISELTTQSDSRKTMTAAEVRSELANSLQSRAKKLRLPTQITALDEALGGGLPPSLTMVGGFGKTGKTTFVATISYNFEAQGIPHLVFSLERHSTDIEALKAGRESQMNAMEISRSFTLPPSTMPRTAIYRHGTDMTIDQIRHEILFQTRTSGIQAALIDYWQLIEGREKGETIEQFRARVAQTLQKTMVDAQIPIILTYQMGEGPQNKEIAAARTAANLNLILHRENSECWLQNIASNITQERDIGGVISPSMILDRGWGPHFRNPTDLGSGV